MTAQSPRRFDIHQHVGRLPELAPEPDQPDPFRADIALRQNFMDSFGIAQAALMPAHAYSAPRGLADVRAINDGLVAYREADPDRFPVIVATLDPRHGVKAADEVPRLKEQGFAAVSWHNRFQGLPMDHPAMVAIMERMNECGLMAMIHCLAGADFEDTWRFRRLVERFPDMTFVALDAMSGAEAMHALLDCARAHGNVHVDLTTSALGPAGVHACLSAIGSERVVFGTNYYSLTVRSRLTELSDLLEAGLSDDEMDRITGDNARRLFGFTARG